MQRLRPQRNRRTAGWDFLGLARNAAHRDPRTGCALWVVDAGEESRWTAVAAEAIEAKPASGQIRPSGSAGTVPSQT
jgi:hypothetical protein